MDLVFSYYDPDQEFKKSKRLIQADKRTKEQKFCERVASLEVKIKELGKTQMFLSKESKKGSNASNNWVEYHAKLLHSYILWVNEKINNLVTNSTMLQLTELERYKIRSFTFAIQTLKQPEYHLKAFLESKCFFHSGPFDSRFLELSTSLYLEKLDPFCFWLTPQQLTSILESSKLTPIKASLTLILLRFSGLNSLGDNLKPYELHFYQLVKNTMPYMYSKPCFDHVLAIMFLAFYEGSFYKLKELDVTLSLAVRMAHILRYHEIGNEIGNIPVINSIPIMETDEFRKKKRLWDYIVITCFSLGSILGEKMVQCYPISHEFSDISRQYQEVPFLILTSKADLGSVPLLKRALPHYKKLTTAFDLINSYHVEVRCKLQDTTFEAIVKLYKSLPRRAFSSVNSQLYLTQQRMDPLIPLDSLFIKILQVTNWLGWHHSQGNWMTFGPIYSIIIYPLLTLYHKPMVINPLAMLDYLTVVPTLDKVFVSNIRRLIDYAKI